MMKKISAIGILVFASMALISMMGCVKRPIPQAGEKPPVKSGFICRIIFATEVSGEPGVNLSPLNNVKEISINEEIIYAFVDWFELEEGKHQCLYRVFDGSGELVFAVPINFVWPESSTTYIWLPARKGINQPGTWALEVYLDGKKVAEKNLVVLSE